MCVRVQFAPSANICPYDSDRRIISIPAATPGALVLPLIRAVLDELAVPQPRLGAVCWCGAPVQLQPRVPEQRRSEQVMNHGA